MLGRGIKDLAEFPQVRLEDAAPGIEGFLAKAVGVRLGYWQFLDLFVQIHKADNRNSPQVPIAHAVNRKDCKIDIGRSGLST